MLMQTFCFAEHMKPYDVVILGAPIWVATPEPGTINTSTVVLE